jgi:RNA polymerase sigma-70 factor, ECF subfamily
VESREEVLDADLAPAVGLAPVSERTPGIAAEDFDGIVRASQRRIFRVIYGLVRDHDTADTLTQECFLRAFEKRYTFRGESSIDTWLIRIAVNLARDHARNRRMAFWKGLFSTSRRDEPTAEILEVRDSSPSAEKALIAREAVQKVWSSIERLPQQQRTVFVLRFEEDMTLQEISQVMDIEVGTVKAHLSRAVSAVRKRLREQQAL